MVIAIFKVSISKIVNYLCFLVDMHTHLFIIRHFKPGMNLSLVVPKYHEPLFFKNKCNCLHLVLEAGNT